MPRICPLQLLTCLSVLLTPGGGILSGEEVPRLVNLMTKFSKKLVSKCVYILILKSTDTHLVDLFMTEGGWALIHTWLQDAIGISNWDLVKEILSLLIVTPVDVERLKLNNIPKLVKSLSKLKDVPTVQDLSSKLVTDWLAIVKSNTRPEEPKVEESVAKIEKVEPVLVTPTVETVDSSQIKVEDSIEEIPASNFYKVTVRDGKQVISRTPLEISELELGKVEVEKLESDRSKSSSVDKKSKSSSSSSKHSSSSRSKSSSSSSSSSSKHKSSSSKSSSSSSRDRDKDRKDKYKDKHKNGLKHSSSKDSKEKQAEKDKDTLAKLKPHSVGKIGRIPKKTGEDKEKDAKETKEVRKSTISIEVRKNTEERPKTVKVFNSKRRSTGLEEEAKPPPPRPVKKPPVPLPATIPLKRSSPIRDVPGTPPEKKLKIDVSVAAAPERPGAIKLIPPKPKPAPFLQESDLFMDALAASATTKKEPKKRKRRLSVSKDTPESPTDEKSTPTSPATSPLGLKNIAPINFYQDTLETSEKDADTTPEEKTDESENKDEQMEAEPTVRVNESGLRGVLVVGKRKGPKKSVKFNDSDLTQVRFFELDETERVNVTKTFMDMAKMEMSSEREALFMSRKLPNEDLMGEQIPWRMLYIIDIPEPAVSAGCKSLEKDIQFAREKSTLQTFYFDKRKIPDSPEEPIPENHQMIDPIVIPLDDSETQDIDLRKTPWPEPKGSPPPPVQEPVIPPQMFTNIPMGFQNFPPHAVPPQGFQGMPPRFGPPQPPGMYPGPPNMMGPPNGNMMGPPGMAPPPEMMQHLNPNAFGHGPGPGPDNFNPMMGGDSPNFPMPFNGPPNMFPPNNFNMNRGGGGGGGGNRGGFRRGGGGGNNNGTWMRMPGPGNWNNRGGGGGGGRGGRICKNVQKHGFCRNMDKGCPFIHPK